MASNLPDYLAAAKPVPQAGRVPWYMSIAQTYAGVMLWFVFWQGLAKCDFAGPGGTLSAGLGVALLGILIGALICHFMFYLVPGLLGQKNGLPLYVVGTSTYGATGGRIMPGLVMGLLQFGWLGVNAYFVGALLCKCFNIEGVQEIPADVNVIQYVIRHPIVHPAHAAIAAVFAAAAAFMGLKGIQYVARVATFFPLIPLTVLVVLTVTTIGGVANFSPSQIIKPDAAGKPLEALEILILLSTVIVGFFATAGAAGADIAMSTRSTKDVHLGGLVGIALATIVAGGLSVLIVAGAYGAGLVPAELKGNLDPLNPLDLMKGGLLNSNVANIFMILLAISSFPGGCFSAFIAATSFKTVMPKINPWLSVGIGTLVSIALAVTGVAGKAVDVFKLIGASFGPVCGAMMAEYLLSGGKWSGPRAGFNPAGWISWLAGFIVGAFQFIAPLIPPIVAYKDVVPCPPVAAFVVGFILYFVLATIGLQSRTLGMPGRAEG
jgi:cytosine permease